MNSSSVFRPLRRGNLYKKLSPTSQPSYRCLSCTLRNSQAATEPPKQNGERFTHFGFETVPEGLKQSKVADVFSSVATSYDIMNDLMSLGIHRLWKDHFVHSLDPGLNPLLYPDSTPKGLNILDVAGGTGDIATRLLDHATLIHNDKTTKVTIADINPEMLMAGQTRLSSSEYVTSGRLVFLESNAEILAEIPDGSVDLYTVAFGIRNFTDIPKALRAAYRVLKPGGVFACLEFSKVENSTFDYVYKRWSFSAIPIIGQLVAGDRDSYQYLVESIERFPDQKTFANMIKEAGFILPKKIGVDVKEANEGEWENLTGGIACIHKGVKPISKSES